MGDGCGAGVGMVPGHVLSIAAGIRWKRARGGGERWNVVHGGRGLDIHARACSVCVLERVGKVLCGGCPSICGLVLCWIGLLGLWGMGGTGASGAMGG